jgi:hypothetical protein
MLSKSNASKKMAFRSRQLFLFLAFLHHTNGHGVHANLHGVDKSSNACKNTVGRFEERINSKGDPVLRSCTWTAAADT